MNITEEKLSKALTALREIAKDRAGGYGYYAGGDPRDFCPDQECVTEQELANHKKACDEWTAAEAAAKPSPDAPCPSGWITPTIHITRAPFGIGSYSYPSESAQLAIDVLKEID